MNISLPLRHALLTCASLLFILLSYISLFWFQDAGAWAGVFFFFAFFSTLLLGIVSEEKWLAALWPVLFLLLGIIQRHTLLLGMDILLGASFSALFLLMQARAHNFLHFSFFLIVEPLLRIVLLCFSIAAAVGIFAGIPPEQIETQVQQGIVAFDTLPLPGEKTLSDVIASMIETGRESLMQNETVDRIIEQRIQEECQGNAECMEQMREVLRDQIENAEQTQSQPTSEEITAEAQGFLRLFVEEWSQKINFSLLTGIFLIILLLPFLGVFSFLLTALMYPLFHLARVSKIIQPKERQVTQQIFI